MEKQYDKRKTEVYKNDEWVQCEMKDLKIGDKFRMFEFLEFTESIYDNCGKAEFEVVEEPYINENGIWTVKTL
jgi:hypothetical protein